MGGWEFPALRGSKGFGFGFGVQVLLDLLIVVEDTKYVSKLRHTTTFELPSGRWKSLGKAGAEEQSASGSGIGV